MKSIVKKENKQKSRSDKRERFFCIKKIRRFLIVLFLILVPAYVFFSAFLYFNQANFIYYPDSQDFEGCKNFSDYQKLISGETRMYYKEKSENSVIVLYHGNAGSSCDRTYLKGIFEKTDKSIIFVEYAGYSNDPRVPSKALIFNDVRNVENFIREKKFKKVLVVGESIGSGPASYHSKIGKVDRLLLLAPFGRIKDVAQYRYPFLPTSLLVKEDYDNINYLKDYSGEMLLIHGTDDKIIPAKFSRNLCNDLGQSDGGIDKECFLISGAKHIDLFNFSEVTEMVENFVKD